MTIQLLNFLYRLRESLWFLPSLMSLTAFGLAVLANWLDELYHHQAHKHWPSWLIYQGDLEGARTLLSTVAGSMITVAGVSFSITMVALSLASSQFGPRLLMNFMRDTGNQIVLGTFVSTFLYCLLALGNVSGTVDYPPAASASIGLLLAVISIFVLIYFIHHVSSTIRAEHVVRVVAIDTMASIRRLIDDSGQELKESAPVPDQWPLSETFTIESHRSGYLQAIDEARIVQQLKRYDGVIKLCHRPGKFINAGEPLAFVHAKRWKIGAAKNFDKYFVIGFCRTDDQDTEYGISQLVEVAVRALSPGINDPHTAISCIDWLGSGLRQIADKPLIGIYRFDSTKKIRLIRQKVDFVGLLDAAFNQIRQNGRNIPSVAIRLLEALDSIYTVAKDTNRREHITQQARLVIDGAKGDDWQSKDIDDLKKRYRHLLENGKLTD
ncbi:DUF2254 domain-containing protein [Sessilibacter sp. MAH3]